VTWQRDAYRITDDLARIDTASVHAFLAKSYWAVGIPETTLRRALENSLCLGLTAPDGTLTGFARAVTDRATFAYLCDVFVLDAHRGRGLGKWLIQCLLEHPDLQGLRRINLVTRDAHGLYAQHGFTAVAHPDRYMERLDPDVYKRLSPEGFSTRSNP
jgi:GNAT superfamily N-acetyltransferase